MKAIAVVFSLLLGTLNLAQASFEGRYYFDLNNCAFDVKGGEPKNERALLPVGFEDIPNQTAFTISDLSKDGWLINTNDGEAFEFVLGQYPKRRQFKQVEFGWRSHDYLVVESRGFDEDLRRIGKFLKVIIWAKQAHRDVFQLNLAGDLIVDSYYQGKVTFVGYAVEDVVHRVRCVFPSAL